MSTFVFPGQGSQQKGMGRNLFNEYSDLNVQAAMALSLQVQLISVRSATVKDLLQQINIQDTEYAPAGDMFELGARVQVKGNPIGRLEKTAC
jgi:malonyl CoA-acyl carrier protein transacylase